MNPSGWGGERTRIVSGKPPQARGEGDAPLAPEERRAIAERLKDEAYRALRNPRRSVVARLSILRALQIVEGADGKPAPVDDWEERLHASMRPRGAQQGGDQQEEQLDEVAHEGEESSDDEAPEA